MSVQVRFLAFIFPHRLSLDLIICAHRSILAPNESALQLLSWHFIFNSHAPRVQEVAKLFKEKIPKHESELINLLCSVANCAEESKKPQRDLPFGIVASLMVCLAFYISVYLVITVYHNQLWCYCWTYNNPFNRALCSVSVITWTWKSWIAPATLHLTKEPFVEEYSVAAKVCELSSCDLCEIARNSDGFLHYAKVHRLGDEYYKRGPNGYTQDQCAQSTNFLQTRDMDG